MHRSRTATFVFLFLCAPLFSGCGYLDLELWTTDEQFERGFGMDGPAGIGGYGTLSSCGGLSRVGHSARLGHSGAASGAATQTKETSRPVSQMTDEEILENTAVDRIYEDRVEPGPVEKAYFATKKKRDRDVLIIY